ncbi:MAG: hypothetical protein AAFY56_12655 [Pseudomonadota bacterium]
MDRQELRVLLISSAEGWIAQCLDYDICAQGSSEDEVKLRFALTVEADLAESIDRHGEPFKGIDPAPSSFHALWGEAEVANQPVSVDGVSGKLDIQYGHQIAA